MKDIYACTCTSHMWKFCHCSVLTSNESHFILTKFLYFYKDGLSDNTFEWGYSFFFVSIVALCTQNQIYLVLKYFIYYECDFIIVKRPLTCTFRTLKMCFQKVTARFVYHVYYLFLRSIKSIKNQTPSISYLPFFLYNLCNYKMYISLLCNIHHAQAINHSFCYQHSLFYYNTVRNGKFMIHFICELLTLLSSLECQPLDLWIIKLQMPTHI